MSSLKEQQSGQRPTEPQGLQAFFKISKDILDKLGEPRALSQEWSPSPGQCQIETWHQYSHKQPTKTRPGAAADFTLWVLPHTLWPAKSQSHRAGMLQPLEALTLSQDTLGATPGTLAFTAMLCWVLVPLWSDEFFLLCHYLFRWKCISYTCCNSGSVYFEVSQVHRQCYLCI